MACHARLLAVADAVRRTADRRHRDHQPCLGDPGNLGGQSADGAVAGQARRRLVAAEARGGRLSLRCSVLFATPLADGAAVLGALPRDLVERFERQGWLLVRNYNDDIGATVADVFGTNDRDAVERYCRANAIDFEWRDRGGLRTRQRRNAVVRHPVSGRRCWFNQIAFLNEWTLAPDVREYLVDVYGPDGQPFNTRFGNGDPIGPDIVEAINDVYEAHTVREPWQAGDLLVVDNIRTAHGREPFEGPREIVVALADGVRLGEGG